MANNLYRSRNYYLHVGEVTEALQKIYDNVDSVDDFRHSVMMFWRGLPVNTMEWEEFRDLVNNEFVEVF